MQGVSEKEFKTLQGDRMQLQPDRTSKFRHRMYGRNGSGKKLKGSFLLS